MNKFLAQFLTFLEVNAHYITYSFSFYLNIAAFSLNAAFAACFFAASALRCAKYSASFAAGFAFNAAAFASKKPFACQIN